MKPRDILALLESLAILGLFFSQVIKSQPPRASFIDILMKSSSVDKHTNPKHPHLFER